MSYGAPGDEQVKKELQHPELRKAEDAFKRGDAAQALLHAKAACAQDPSNVTAWIMAGIVLLTDRDRADESLAHLRAGLEANPGNTRLWSTYAGALNTLGKAEAAVEAWGKAAEYDPSDPEPLCNIGLVYFNEKRWREAMEALGKAAEVAPSDPIILEHLYLACMKAGEVDRCGVVAAQSILTVAPMASDAEVEAELLAVMRVHGPKIPVEAPGESAIRRYFDEHRSKYDKPSVRLFCISIPKASRSRDYVEKLRADLAAGRDFAEAARVNSDDGAAGRGGDWGWVPRGYLQAHLEQAAFALNPGELSGILEDGTHYRIMAVSERLDGTPLEAVRDQIVEDLKQQMRDEKLRQWIAQARVQLAGSGKE